MATFTAPANLTDFDRASNPAGLKDSWHRRMLNAVTQSAGDSPAFFNALQPPSGTTPVVAAPEWTGLPRTIKRLAPGSVANAAALVETSVSMGDPDPMEGRFTPVFRRSNGKPFPGPRYRPQDEYLEWVTRKDASGVITEVLFTCEGPEYWSTIAADQTLLLALYREISGDNTIALSELLFSEDVSWDNPNNGHEEFSSGDYNPYNARNIEFAIHLTQPANTLGAEIALARDASRLYGRPGALVTTDPALVCCAGYGGVNRMSDPTIGAAVNSLVRPPANRRVSLRNPIGLYMKDIRLSAIAMPDNTPLPAGVNFFETLRGSGDMIVRARFRVPPGVTTNGQQVRVGDLTIAGERIVTGGQLADLVTMRLFAIHVPGAPAQTPAACKGRPCFDRDHPEIIVPIAFGSQCPPDGIARTLDAAAAGGPVAAVAATPLAASEHAGIAAVVGASRRPRIVK